MLMSNKKNIQILAIIIIICIVYCVPKFSLFFFYLHIMADTPFVGIEHEVEVKYTHKLLKRLFFLVDEI